MISVIVPVYNVQPYLVQCVESIRTQTFCDLEIILVDDGSSDECPRLCDEYAAKDARIKVIHKSNGGLSDARNAGVKIAVGEWIYFADSDDWLESDAIEKLYGFAITNDCNVVQGNMYYVYSDHMLYRKVCRRERKANVLSRDEAMRELIINDRVKNFAWGKLYKAELIKDLEFPVGWFFEDCFWQHRVVDRVCKYGIIDVPLYYYRQREDSISSTSSEKIKDLLDGYGCRLVFIRVHYPQYYNLMCKMHDRIYAQVYPQAGPSGVAHRIFDRVLSKLRTINRYKTVYNNEKTDNQCR